MIRLFRGFIALAALFMYTVVGAGAGGMAPDGRHLDRGVEIPSENYADQPYVVKTADGVWLCVLTTGPGIEGKPGQHVASTRSSDQGQTWSPLVNIEAPEGPEASWAVPLATLSGRIYVFYNYNAEQLPPRADTLGWYVFKYTDDGGLTWSDQRYRLPMRETDVDRANDAPPGVQRFWSICKPLVQDGVVYIALTKLQTKEMNGGEGWVFVSDNLLSERDPEKIRWELLPEGEQGIRAADLGLVQEEHNLVPLGNGAIYCMYRTTQGYTAHSYSHDGARTWTTPVAATYTPGGRPIKNPRACPKVWRTVSGNYLLWYHNHSGTNFHDRNPAWISGGVLKDSQIHWSEPEILFYTYDLSYETGRFSYPDLVEEDGRYWFTTTQKSTASIHEADAALIEGLWHQDEADPDPAGRVVDWLPDQGTTAPADGWIGPAGFSVALWLSAESLARGITLVDDGEAGRVRIAAAADQTIEIAITGDANTTTWSTDPGTIRPGTRQQVVFTVDFEARIITTLVDGKLCDGGAHRHYGWGRLAATPEGLPEKAALRIGPGVEHVQWYKRPLRTSEAVRLYRAGNE